VREADKKEVVEMETERAVAQAPDKEKWAKVQIYMPTHICTGYVYCSHRRRLLDVLNGIPAGPLHISDEFLPVSEAKIPSPDGKEASVKSTHINKANILFLKEIGGGHRGLGGQVGHKPYPYVPKPFTKSVKLYMPLYTLTGQMYWAKGRGVSDVLNSELRFLALTNVEICSSAGSIEPGVSFLAVNKGQIILLEELGHTTKGES